MTIGTFIWCATANRDAGFALVVLIGDASPFEAPRNSASAVFVAVSGYLLVPTIVGVMITAAIASLAARWRTSFAIGKRVECLLDAAYWLSELEAGTERRRTSAAEHLAQERDETLLAAIEELRSLKLSERRSFIEDELRKRPQSVLGLPRTAAVSESGRRGARSVGLKLLGGLLVIDVDFLLRSAADEEAIPAADDPEAE